MEPLSPLELQYITLEDIQRKKGEVRLELEKQREEFLKKTKQLSTSYHNPIVGGNGIVGAFRTGYAIFNGISNGIRIMRSIRKMFRR